MSPRAPDLPTTQPLYGVRRFATAALVLVAVFATMAGPAPAEPTDPVSLRQASTAAVTPKTVSFLAAAPVLTPANPTATLSEQASATASPTSAAPAQPPTATRGPSHTTGANDAEDEQRVSTASNVAASVLGQPNAEDNPSTQLGDPARVDEVLASISFDWQTRLPGWTVRFEAGDVTGGLTSGATKSIVVTSNGAPRAELARILAHEIGHAADLALNNTGKRRRWKSQRNLDDTVSWWPQGPGHDFATGAGDFAECFTTWQLATPSLSRFGPCTESDLDLVAELVVN